MRLYETGVELISSWLPEGFVHVGEYQLPDSPYHATEWAYITEGYEGRIARVAILSELLQLGSEDDIKATVIAEVQALRKLLVEAGLPVWGEAASVHSSEAHNEEETHG